MMQHMRRVNEGINKAVNGFSSGLASPAVVHAGQKSYELKPIDSTKPQSNMAFAYRELPRTSGFMFG
jgi:hypothetical protein